MNTVYTCVSSLCCCLIVCSLVRIIAPSGTTGKMISTVLGIFILCCLISPVVSLVTDYDMDTLSDYGDTVMAQGDTEDYDARVLSQTEQYLEAYCTKLLSAQSITAKDIQVSVDFDSDDSIYVHRAVIYIDKSAGSRAGEISTVISDSLMIEPEIIISE